MPAVRSSSPPARRRRAAVVWARRGGVFTLWAACAVPALAPAAPPAARPAATRPAASPAAAQVPRCSDDGETLEGQSTPAAALAAPAPADPRGALQTLVRDALERSYQVGAARLLAEAAEDDIREAKAAKAIQANAGAGLGPGGSQSIAGSENSAVQLRTSVSVSQILWDGGRADRMVDWRSNMAESARQGLLSAQEQLALSAVSLAFERSRYRQQVNVYGQYVHKMACLVEALETIVRADRGRASELVQARKSFQQAEISQAQAQSALRQVEVRLRRLVGDGLPPADGLPSLMLTVPPLETVESDVQRSAEIAALNAQATAMGYFAQAAAAADKPQLSWNVTGSAAQGRGGNAGNQKNSSYSLGLALNVPLLSPGAGPARDAARRRARAAELQRDEALEARRFRATEIHEQTTASFDRARRTAAVLRESQQVRGFTLQQWQQLGRRSLFDVMSAEGEHYNLRVAYINALHDAQELNASLTSLGQGLLQWLR